MKSKHRNEVLETQDAEVPPTQPARLQMVPGENIVKKHKTSTGTGRATPSRLGVSTPRPSSSDVSRKTVTCATHFNSEVKFLCTKEGCFKELCDMCILDHRDHISSICPIHELIEKHCQELEAKDLQSVKGAIVHRESESFNKIDTLLDEFYGMLKSKVANLKKRMLYDSQSKENFLQNITRFRELASQPRTQQDPASPELVGMLKEYLSFTSNPKCSSVSVDPSFYQRFDQLFEECVLSKENFESGEEGNPKLIHWFEWENKKLYIYDIIKNYCKNVSLDMPFSVPLYSRSIMAPSGMIYLLGGEDSAGTVRAEVYRYNATQYEENTKLEMRCCMTKGKYDFSVCYLDEHIYTIGGKDTKSEVLSYCERYNIKRNVWEPIASLNVKRYAASCTAVRNRNSILLFGGIHEEENKTVDCIEEYIVDKDIWVNLNVKTLIWQSVEISAAIQIKHDEILIFGGNSPKLRDTDNSYIFNLTSHTFKKSKTNLKKPQVFISAPFLYANKIYALGNEYYVKKRNINRYDITTGEWDIILYN